MFWFINTPEFSTTGFSSLSTMSIGGWTSLCWEQRWAVLRPSWDVRKHPWPPPTRCWQEPPPSCDNQKVSNTAPGEQTHSRLGVLRSEGNKLHLQRHGLISQYNVEQKQHIFKNRQDETVWQVWRENSLTEKGRGPNWATQRVSGRLLVFHYLTWLVVSWMGPLVMICQVYDLYIFLQGRYPYNVFKHVYCIMTIKTMLSESMDTNNT